MSECKPAGGRRDESGLVRNLLAGALSGAAASWVMETVQSRISGLGSERTKQREKSAQGNLEPATYRAAEATAGLVGIHIADEQKPAAGEIFHYLTGVSWGVVLGALAHTLGARGVLPGLAFGAGVWVLGDELLVPAFGFSRSATQYPASTHLKGLAAHLVYGATAGAGVRLLT